MCEIAKNWFNPSTHPEHSPNSISRSSDRFGSLISMVDVLETNLRKISPHSTKHQPGRVTGGPRLKAHVASAPGPIAVITCSSLPHSRTRTVRRSALKALPHKRGARGSTGMNCSSLLQYPLALPWRVGGHAGASSSHAP